MVHLLICITLIIAYVILRLKGIEDSVLKDSIIMAVAYFFGASSASLITNTLGRKNTPEPPRDSGQSATINGKKEN